MNHGSPHPGLFGTGTDPSVYTGPPHARYLPSPVRSTGRALKSKCSLADVGEDCVEEVTTPRSIAACRACGVAPKELKKPTMTSTLAAMREAKENTGDKEIIKMRLGFFLRLHKQKLKAVLEEYDKGAEEHGSQRQCPLPSTMLANEERTLQKITDANKSRLRQQLLRSQLMAKQRRKEDERLEAERHEAERREQDTIRRMAEQSRKEEEATALRSRARQEEQRQQAERAKAQLALYEQKDAALQARLAEKRAEITNRNAHKGERNAMRQEKIKSQSDYLMTKRREELQQRMQQFEEGRRHHRALRAAEHAQRRAEAQERTVQIAEAMNRRDELLAAKVELAVAKERRAEEKIQERQHDRSEGIRRKMLQEAEREAQRQETYEAALENANQRIRELQQKDEDERIRAETLKSERAHARKLRQEKARQTQLDKLDKVHRSRRVDESKREDLMSYIDSKHSTIVAVRATKDEMAKRRREQREEAERSRVVAPDDTPGPGDYRITQWHFGLPTSALGPRTVQRGVPPPGAVTSPGPSVYRVEACDRAALRTAAAFSFSKGNRFNREKPLSITPGPQDYAPESPSPIRSGRAATPSK